MDAQRRRMRCRASRGEQLVSSICWVCLYQSFKFEDLVPASNLRHFCHGVGFHWSSVLQSLHGSWKAVGISKLVVRNPPFSELVIHDVDQAKPKKNKWSLNINFGSKPSNQRAFLIHELLQNLRDELSALSIMTQRMSSGNTGTLTVLQASEDELNLGKGTSINPPLTKAISCTFNYWICLILFC